MHRKRGLKGDFQNFLNLDSLVDIVSNNVGILVILAVFMAMFSLLEKNKQDSSNTHPTVNIEKIKIPWSHVSQKNILLILLRSNRLLYLDRILVYQELKKYLSGREPLPKYVNLDQFSIELEVGSGHAHCLKFLPYPGTGKWWHQFSMNKGEMQKLMEKFPPEENYFFFFVDSDSFEIFREIRRSLWIQNFEVGWKPIRIETPLRYCSGIGQVQEFLPQ